MIRHRLGGLALLVLAVGTGTVTEARGGMITSLSVNVTAQADGLHLYEYILSNSADSTVPVLAFRLDVDALADLRDIGGPAGWASFYLPGDSHAYWESADESFDLQPGGSYLFQFLSPLSPHLTGYAILGLDGEDFTSRDGTTLGPRLASVPEPSSIALSLLGMIGLGLSARRLGTRKSP